jgi:hypothetical protein
MVVSAYIKKPETSEINNVVIYLKLLKNKNKPNPKTSRQREIIKIKARSMRVKANYIKN